MDAQIKLNSVEGSRKRCKIGVAQVSVGRDLPTEDVPPSVPYQYIGHVEPDVITRDDLLASVAKTALSRGGGSCVHKIGGCVVKAKLRVPTALDKHPKP